MENSNLGFLDQETNLKIWCSDLINFLIGCFQNGIGFQNGNAFENKFKTMIKTCERCFEAHKELS